MTNEEIAKKGIIKTINDIGIKESEFKPMLTELVLNNSDEVILKTVLKYFPELKK